MGGEKKRHRFIRFFQLGSPPHGRGKAYSWGKAHHGMRITPAWAGKRQRLECVMQQWRDHPRMGGEKVDKVTFFGVIQGSPPHGRGKVLNKNQPRFCSGITPAWAGKSPGCAILSVQREDHPRMGGEKEMELAYHENAWGSPPHGRGKVL